MQRELELTLTDRDEAAMIPHPAYIDEAVEPLVDAEDRIACTVID